MVSVKGDRELSGRLLVAAKGRDIDLKRVLSYELSPVPLSLAHLNGTLRKTPKSVLLTEIEKTVKVESTMPHQTKELKTAHIFDAMAQVHKLGSFGSKTFKDLAKKHYEFITSPLGHNGCERVDLIFDQYKNHSIKQGERIRRGDHLSMDVDIHHPDVSIPMQWNKFLLNTRNKQRLCDFLSE